MAPPIVTRFLISLDENKLIGFLLSLLITGIAVVVALQQKAPVQEEESYRAIGRLSLSNPLPTFTVAGQELQTQGESINLTTLLSPQVLQYVVDRLKSDGYNFSIGKIQDIITKKKLVVNLPEVGEAQAPTRLITLEYKDQTTPSEVRQVLTVFMEELVAESYRINTSQLQTRITSLEERLDVVLGQLTDAEKRFYQYITTDGSTLITIQNGSLFGGITSAQQQKRQLEVILAGIEAEIKTLEKQLGLNPKEAYTSSALSNDPIIAGLRAQILEVELQLELLSKDLRPEHPTIVELKKQKKVNEKLLEERADEVIGKDGIFEPLTKDVRRAMNLDASRSLLANRLVALQSERDSLRQQFKSVSDIETGLKKEYELFPDKQIKQARLVQEVQSQRILYQTIFAALTDARSAEVEADSSLSIAQAPFLVPVTAEEKETINPVLIIGIGAVLGILSALGLIFLLATLDERLHTPEELREALSEKSIPILAELPVVQSLTSSGRSIPMVLDSHSEYLPYYERFRSNIRRFEAENTKIILITSISNNEGKSVSAYNLAIAYAYAGKRTLLIEADLRDKNPFSRQYFGIDLGREVSDNPLSYYDLHPNGRDSFQDQMIKRIPEIPNFSIIPSPGFQQQAAAIIESSEMQVLLKYARTQYDIIIFDTPSLDRCNDALLLERSVDGIILVTRPSITQRNLLNTTIDEFLEAELPLIGIAINEVDSLVVTKTYNDYDNNNNGSGNGFGIPLNTTEEVEAEEIQYRQAEFNTPDIDDPEMKFNF